ncbi:MAG: DUF5806 family protein [Methanoregula sp.]|jgi:hypothetical protein|nr:DUF5806 family protein [Methanoregula sp.]
MDDSHIQQEINKYKKFKKVDGATYRKVNQFLRKRTYITAREWALARLCTDFRTSGGAEMTFIGKHLPELVPFMEDTYTPQAVNQARNSFKKKVRKASATFFYGAMCGFFTTDELDDLLFEASEVARFLLEVEGTTLDIDEEIDIEDRITKVMRSVGEAAKTILRSRAEEEESPDQLPVPVPPKPKAVNSPHGIQSQTTDKTGNDKKTKDRNSLPDSHSLKSPSKNGEILPAINKKIALEGSLSVGEDTSEDIHNNPVQEPAIITTVVKPTTDLLENRGE